MTCGKPTPSALVGVRQRPRSRARVCVRASEPKRMCYKLAPAGKASRNTGSQADRQAAAGERETETEPRPFLHGCSPLLLLLPLREAADQAGCRSQKDASGLRMTSTVALSAPPPPDPPGEPSHAPLCRWPVMCAGSSSSSSPYTGPPCLSVCPRGPPPQLFGGSFFLGGGPPAEFPP